MLTLEPVDDRTMKGHVTAAHRRQYPALDWNVDADVELAPQMKLSLAVVRSSSSPPHAASPKRPRRSRDRPEPRRWDDDDVAGHDVDDADPAPRAEA